VFTSKHFASKHFASHHFTQFGSGFFIFSINGVSALDYLKPNSLRISQNINNRGTARFTIVGLRNSKGVGYLPTIGHEVVIEQSPCKGEPFKRIFAGYIKDIQSKNSYCGKTVFHDVACVDYNSILDRRLVINIYQPQTAYDLIHRIWNDYLKEEGIIFKEVTSAQFNFSKSVFAYVKVSKAYNDIANASGLFWYIDYYKGLHFILRSSFSTGTFLSPDCVESQDTNSEFCYFIKKQSCNRGIRHGNFVVDRRSDQYVNQQYIIAGFSETEERTEQFYGDGKRKTFSLAYKLSHLAWVDGEEKVIAPDAIKVDATNKSVAEVETTIAQWYYDKGSNAIVQDDAETELTSGQVLTVNYVGLFNIVKRRNLPSAIAQRAGIEHSSGIYEDVFDDESIESAKYAEDYALGLLRRFSKMPINISFFTDTKVLDIGEILSVKLDDHGIDIPDGFLVDSIEIEDLDATIFRYHYRIISTESFGGWQDFWKKIEYFGRQLKLKEQSKITVVEDVGDALDDGILVGQTFTSSTGILDLETQDQNYERCLCHIGRALSFYSFHCVPQVVKLFLV
jgi:hypothetical protein